jgi:hypothetical protein
MTPRADEALAEVRRLDEARTPGEWWFEEQVLAAPVWKMLGSVDHPDNRAYIAASTHPTTGWRATAEKAARLEEALREIEETTLLTMNEARRICRKALGGES